ncbi:MAG: GTPase Era [Eubacterium sp.]|nr:GTPase Era [Eubacterium sp.]
MKEKNFKSGFVAILGRPNVGKSTIMNHLIGMKIAAVSKRAQTTRKRIQTVYTDDRGQIIFLDTPGINKAETKLGEYMLESAVDTLKTADMIMWIIEPSDFIGTGERYVAELIGKAAKSANLPVLLVVNKADTAEEDFVKKTFDKYSEYMMESESMKFDKCLAVSATEGSGLEDLKISIFEMLPEGPMYFDEDTVTDETEREIVAEFVREKCLRNLDKEIPHGIAVVVDKMHSRISSRGENIVDIDATIICEREAHKGIIIGKKGAMLRKIGSESRRDIEDMLEEKVNLKLWVKVRPGWRDKKNFMSEYGYKK